MTQQAMRSRVQKAASGAKLVGGVFVAAGGFPMLLGLGAGRGGWFDEILGMTTSVILIGPGVWYLVAAYFLRRRQDWAVKTTYRVALGQLVCVVLSVIVSMLVNDSHGEIIVPAILAIFFLPALLALMFDIRFARRELIAGAGYGFSVRVLKVTDATEAPASQMMEPQINTDERR